MISVNSPLLISTVQNVCEMRVERRRDRVDDVPENRGNGARECVVTELSERQHSAQQDLVGLREYDAEDGISADRGGESPKIEDQRKTNARLLTGARQIPPEKS